MDCYYQARAREYESVYAKPERQSDLARLKAWLAAEARGRTVLEVACGTGYWTAIAAATARRILATDRNGAPLSIARSKALGPSVVLRRADAYHLPEFAQCFDCGMAHFWWSHMPHRRTREFLVHFASRLAAGAKLLLIDNNFVSGSSTPISRRDGDGNTYQMRTLATGERYEVLKNFPSGADIERALGAVSSRIDILQLTHYWAARALIG